MILACNNISKNFGTDVILEQISFHINEREKAAIVGINGAGKSTLFKIIVGELPADTGEVTWAKGTRIGYLSQHQDLTSENTIYDEVLSVKSDLIHMEEKIRELELAMKEASGEELSHMLTTYTNLNHSFELQNGYAYKSEVFGVLKGLGFTQEEFEKKVTTLSGGQKTRVALGKLLLSTPDIILLDEPTNHLDMTSIAWLETFLQNYNGAVVIIAHDRYFLDRIVTKIIELDNTHAQTFQGNYSDYAVKKEALRQEQIHHYLSQQKEIKHQEEVIAKLRSFNREKSIKRAESREKMLDKMERVEKPVELKADMNIHLIPRTVSGNDVLTVKGLSKAFGNNLLFENIDFEIRRGERVAIIGNNGTGKTTILKLLNGLIAADSGEIKLGAKVHIGYYDQEHQVLHMEKNLFEEIQDTYPNLDNTTVRNVLAAFLFTGDNVFKQVKELSGGERGRVSLAKLMLSEANFLILDEPTNHLDITSKEILEYALLNYTGTILYVSHDRYFINRTATRILDLRCKMLLNYIGNYDYYLEKKPEVEKKYLGFALEDTTSLAKGSDRLTNHKQLYSGLSSFSPSLGKNATTGENATDKKSSQTAGMTNPAMTAGTAGKQDWLAKKEEQAKERKRQNDLKKVEAEIEKLEARDTELDGMLTEETVYSDPAKLMELNNEKTEIATRLEMLMEEWEGLAAEI
jgi:ATP-binding cassette subfamily F protein 3